VDTTKILLTHDFQLQPGLTFVLLAGLAYAAGRVRLSYVVGAGALLAYESSYLALFAMPLLVRRWDRTLPRKLVRHVAITAGVVVLAVLARFAVGEVRATQSVGGVGAIVPPLIGSLVLGPLRSLGASLYQPLRLVPSWDVEALLLALLAGLAIAACLWRSRPEPRWREVLEVGGAGLAMLILGYGLAFTHFPPNAVVGRGTSVHLGATLGMAVLAAAATWGLLSIRPRIGAALVGAYFALAVGYYVSIERDFIRSWQLQRAFWQQVVACCSDLQDGTVLLYEFDADPPTTFIFTNSWADALVLRQIYRFPAEWHNPPRLFSVTEWQSRIEPDGAGGMRWWVPGASWDEHWEPLPQDNLIVLRQVDGKLARATGDVNVSAGTVRLKQPGPAAAFPPAQLYRYLLQ
jgi:hypothetical protein